MLAIENFLTSSDSTTKTENSLQGGEDTFGRWTGFGGSTQNTLRAVASTEGLVGGIRYSAGYLQQ